MRAFFAGLILSLIFINANLLLAQNKDDGFHPGIFFGPSFPQGQYAATHGDRSGYAEVGISVMLNLRKNFSNFGWLSSLIYSSNRTDANAMQDQLVSTGLVADDHNTFWLLTGLSYNISLSENVFIYGSGQVGLYHANFPDIYTTDGLTKTTYKYSTANTLGLAVGTGISFFKINIAVRYCMASPTYERTGDWLGKNGAKNLKIDANNLFLFLGYEF